MSRSGNGEWKCKEFVCEREKKSFETLNQMKQIVALKH